MAPKVERIVENLELGEGPHWDVATQSLYFVDIFGKAIHKYCPATKKHTKATIDDCVSLIIPIEGEKNKFLISIGRELVTITWDGESDKPSKIEKLAEVENKPETVGNRFNDGKCDPTGRLWTGTMGIEPESRQIKPFQANFYSFDSKGSAKTHLTKIGISNGLAWSSDGKSFYYIDSHAGTIDKFDCDLKNATIANRTPIFTLSKHNIAGLPDGMTIDTDGNLWVAIFNGYCVIKIDPRKPETLLDTISLPAKQVTSAAFGGGNLDELYVTTAAFTIDGEELPPPNHGAMYKITGTGASGFPGVHLKLQ